MIAPIKKPTPPRSAQALHNQFVDHVLPVVRRHASIQFRHLRGQNRDDCIQEAVAVAWYFFTRLVDTGKDPIASLGGITHFAVRRVRSGRCLAKSSNHDVLSLLAQQQHGFEVHSLDDESCDPGTGWKAAVSQDTRTASVPDTVAFRVDFADWLGGLKRRDRGIAEHLAAGDRPGHVAERFGVCPAMISQKRRALRRSWKRFRGEDGVEEAAHAAL